MKRRIFIYYSLSGNGDIVSDYLNEKHYDIRRVEVEDELPKSKVLRILSGGFLAGIHHKSKLVNFNKDIKKYQSVVIGSPVWNSNLSCPINAVLDELDLTGKRITFILYSGSVSAKRLEKHIKDKFKDATVIHLKEPKKNKDEVKKIESNHILV